jgi:hypothetical protein
MSLVNNTDNTWKNTEENSAPTIEEPIERLEVQIEQIVSENTPLVDSISDIKEQHVEEINESRLPIESTLTESEPIVEPSNDNDNVETENKPISSLNIILHKIKNMTNPLHKKLNLKCALCSSV